MYLYKIFFVETRVKSWLSLWINNRFPICDIWMFNEFKSSYHGVWESDVKDTQLNFVINLLNHRKGYLLFLVTITH